MSALPNNDGVDEGTTTDNNSSNGYQQQQENPKAMNIVLPIRMVSKVVRGFGRGSKDLGIPTANLDRDELKSSTEFDNLPTGIYWGYARMLNTENSSSNDDDVVVVYKTAISIGYNPTYGNERKTIEPHLIANENDPCRHKSKTGETLLQDFYNQTCRLSVVGYIRPELPFEGLDKLVAAIKNDIATTVQLADNTNDNNSMALKERAWVTSEESVV